MCLSPSAAVLSFARSSATNESTQIACLRACSSLKFTPYGVWPWGRRLCDQDHSESHSIFLKGAGMMCRAAAEDTGAHAQPGHDTGIPGLRWIRARGAGTRATGRSHLALRQLVLLPGPLLLRAPVGPPRAPLPGDWWRLHQGTKLPSSPCSLPLKYISAGLFCMHLQSSAVALMLASFGQGYHGWCMHRAAR